MAQEKNNATPKKRSSGRLVLILFVLWLLVAAASSVMLYFIPKAKGDSFATNLLRLNADGLVDDACGPEDLRDIGREITSVGSRLGQALVAVTIGGNPGPVIQNITDDLSIESDYNILTGRYTFRFASDSDVSVLGFRAEAGFETPEITIHIRNSFTSACVESS